MKYLFLSLLTIITCSSLLSQVTNDDKRIEVRALKATTTGMCDIFSDENFVTVYESPGSFSYEVCWTGDGDSPSSDTYISTFDAPLDMTLFAYENSGFLLCEYESDFDVCDAFYSKDIPTSGYPSTFSTYSFNPAGTQWNATLKSMWGYKFGSTPMEALQINVFPDHIFNHINKNTDKNLSESNAIGYSNTGGQRDGNDVFYRINTSSYNFRVTITTATDETDFDTYLSLYKYENNTLTLLTEDNDSGGSLRAEIKDFILIENTSYIIVVEGYNSGDNGLFNLEIRTGPNDGDLCCKECYDELVLNNSNDDGSVNQTNEAFEVLTSNRNTTGTGRSIKYQSGNSLTLSPGFRISSVNDFSAGNAQCGENFNGIWKSSLYAPPDGRWGSIGCAVGDYGFIGMGEVRDMYSNYIPVNDFWKVNSITGIWTQLPDFPGGNVENAVCFTLGNKIYVGLGFINFFGYQNGFYVYDVATNTWSSIAPYPGTVQGDGMAMSIGDKGYVGMAGNNEFYEYDPFSDSWTAKASWPVIGDELQTASGCAHGNLGYVVRFENFYSYSPSTNTWTEKSIIGSVFLQDDVELLSIDNYIYCLSVKLGAFELYGEYGFKYSPDTDSWTIINSHLKVLNPIAFVINKRIYFGTGEYVVTSPFGNEEYFLTSQIQYYIPE
jgi:N-acetylneuraminic acid mutarotase